MNLGRRETLFLLLGDCVLLALSLWLALAARSATIPSTSYFTEHVVLFIPVFLLSILIFYIAGLYERQTRLIKSVLGMRILGAQAANVTVAAVFFFVISVGIAPKTILVLYLIISVLLISTWRFFAVPYVSLSERRKALLIGTGPDAERVFKETNANRMYYIAFTDFIDMATTAPKDVPALVARALQGDVDLIVIDSRATNIREELPKLYDSMLTGVRFAEFSSFYESVFDRVPLAHIDHAWLLECLPTQHFTYDVAKRTLDLLGALIGSVIALPFILIAAFFVSLSGGQPFIFHDRIGKGGKVFKIVKIRTMLLNDHGDPELRARNRVTGVGKILRRTRIDELPQLWNILKGELSFIGPRPELPSIAEVYEAEIPYYAVRHLIPPGLSGWAQIYDHDAPRGGADVERTRRKLSYDLYYLKHRSFGLDVAIALKTLRTLLSFSGT